MNKEELTELLKEKGVSEFDNVATSIYNSFSELINKEKEIGISSYKKKDNEVIKFKNALRDAGYNKETDGDIQTFIDSIKGDKKKVQELNTTKGALESKLDALTQKIDEMSKREVEIKTKANNTKISSVLSKALDNKMYGANYVIESLINNKKVKVNDNDDVVGYDGENEVGLDNFLKTILESNKDQLKSTQHSGSGTPGGETSTSSINLKDMSRDEVEQNIEAIRKEIEG